MPRVYRDASTVLAAPVGSRVIGEAARGRESVAKMTPDETTATAAFVEKWGGAEGRRGR